MYDAAQSYIAEESPQTAYEITNNFAQLRKTPPENIRNAFFPTPASKLDFKGSPALYRPILKTDQGAGTFSYFNFGTGNNNSIELKTSGLAIPEIHFIETLENGGLLGNEDVKALLNDITNSFKIGNLPFCREQLNQLSNICQNHNIETNRKADVGRGLFFFIRPSEIVGENSIVDKKLMSDFHEKLDFMISNYESRACYIKQMVSDGVSIKEAIQKSKEIDISIKPDKKLLLYFQTDVIFKKNGEFIMDKINIPDVGFFLTQIKSQGNKAFEKVQNIADNITKNTFNYIYEEFKKTEKQNLALVTRDSVIDNNEDTLEHLEIAAFQNYFENQGINVNVYKLSESCKIPKESFTLLLNVNNKNEGFNDLIQRSVDDKDFICYPDPFVVLLKDEMHTHNEIKIDKQEFFNLKAIAEPINYEDSNSIYRQMLALKSFLFDAGFKKEDIFYITDASGKLAPAFRYDLKSFSLALKEFDSSEKVYLRGLDFKPNDAIIFGDDGPRLAAHRFTCIRK